MLGRIPWFTCMVLQLGLRKSDKLVEVPLCSTGPGTSFQVGELARLAICHPHGDVELRPLLLPLSTPNADLALGMLVDDVLRWRACAQCCPGESGLPVQHWTPRY